MAERINRAAELLSQGQAFVRAHQGGTMPV